MAATDEVNLRAVLPRHEGRPEAGGSDHARIPLQLRPRRAQERWVYMSATLSPWGAELARGDGPGRIYIVEPTGPFVDDPDLTDKRFPGNPTKSYRSRYPLRVVGEVTDWQGHSPEEIKAMMDAHDRLYARKPSGSPASPVRPTSTGFTRELMSWRANGCPTPEYLGCMLLMLIKGADVEVFWAMTYRSEARGETRLDRASSPAWTCSRAGSESDIPLSGRITDVTAWHEGWVGVIESCVTEIGLSLETRMWIAVDADQRPADVPRGGRRTRTVMAAESATRARSAHRYRTRRDLGLRDRPVRSLLDCKHGGANKHFDLTLQG